MHCYTIMSYFVFLWININRQSYLHCSTVFNFLGINCFFSCYCLIIASTRELRFDWPLVRDLLFWTHWQCNCLLMQVCQFLYSLVSTVFLLNHKYMAVPIDFFTSVPFWRWKKVSERKYGENLGSQILKQACSQTTEELALYITFSKNGCIISHQFLFWSVLKISI